MAHQNCADSAIGFAERELARLEPANDWRPDAMTRLAAARQRHRALRTTRVRWASAAVAGAVIFLAVPVTRAFGVRCLEACTNVTERVAQYFSSDEPEAAAPKVVGAAIGDIVPDFVGRDASGTPLSLSSLRGRVVLVNFWATWCGPCRGEISLLNELQARFEAEGLAVIGVSLDHDGWPAVSAFRAAVTMNYPVTLGTDDVAEAFGDVNVLPATFLIDRQGQIVAKMKGPLQPGRYDSEIARLLQ